MDKCPKCGEPMQICGNIFFRGKKVEVLRCPKCNLRKLNL
ncbi:MAG: zf-TFIIB domain-containing protein [Candidatus Parvarchaeota archaeon]|nr:zf-TFIIB domain-containing protein [Candidatus Haiyanarchaeum thermophilum]MCW1304061.1 zf-TFIIB domain-containing protein [Candidatus Haiyanarchaeum thermophilum]